MTKRTTGSMLKIGEVAERARVSLRTLRHYDAIGLLPPSGRSDGGFRLYTEADYRRLETIQGMTALGWSLEQVTETMDTLAELDAPQTASQRQALLRDLAQYAVEAQDQRQQLAEKLERADRFITILQARRSRGTAAA
ncbi:MerR family transcriptional regulator [Kocuria rosea]|uniref:MerR family transcriptional regulator n=1 Tax=Kocuria rosea TaxID=1275 RepID=A0A4R5Y1A3_KOCRO|nr:MerR family transcriptional regulator [Kocuria rosea]TDL38150.1 MerR family transcriptional regulator [Kocuria rosea]